MHKQTQKLEARGVSKFKFSSRRENNNIYLFCIIRVLGISFTFVCLWERWGGGLYLAGLKQGRGDSHIKVTGALVQKNVISDLGMN